MLLALLSSLRGIFRSPASPPLKNAAAKEGLHSSREEIPTRPSTGTKTKETDAQDANQAAVSRVQSLSSISSQEDVN